MAKFDDIKVGDKAELVHIITQSDIDRFVDLTGDDNKIHVDKEYASKTSFKKPVAHGMLGVSFISTVIGTKLPGDGALWFGQNIEFLQPVRVGDSITVKAEVIKKIERIQAIELSTDIYNQNNQKVVTGNAKVKLIKQEEVTPERIENKIEKRVALVVGGTGGIGRATCMQLAEDGFDVMINYCHNVELAKKIKEQIIVRGKKALTVNADITEFEQVQNMINKTVRKLGTITVVANCATVKIPNIKIDDLAWKHIQEQFDLNVKGSFNIMKCVIPIMGNNKYGKIIGITTQAIEKPSAQWLHYITAKSALHGFTKALAFELAHKGIRINLVSPGMTDTDLIADIPERVRLITAAQTPLRRIATAEDVAYAISYLASEKSDFMTGETVRVNGGQVMI